MTDKPDLIVIDVNDVVKKLENIIKTAIRKAVEAEREACANIATQTPFDMTMTGDRYANGAVDAARKITAYIRNRSNGQADD